ncbi:CBS domain-containing protein cbsx1, chloroplastic [Dionaea muscipula]
MGSILVPDPLHLSVHGIAVASSSPSTAANNLTAVSASFSQRLPRLLLPRTTSGSLLRVSYGSSGIGRSFSTSASSTLIRNSPPTSGSYTVGDFMTRKENLHVVKPSTSVDEALEALVEYRITGFPVVDDEWNLVGVVSDYDLLALDSISGSRETDSSMFPDVDSTWKVFNEIQKLLSKTNGQVIAEVMTPAPLVVQETTNLEDAARLLLETRYRRLPVVDADGKLVGIITRGNVIRAALHIKRCSENAEK